MNEKDADIVSRMSKDFHKLFDKYEGLLHQDQVLYAVLILALSIGIQIAASDKELNRMIVAAKKRAIEILKATNEGENDKS
jgi:hypothetical protein